MLIRVADDPIEPEVEVIVIDPPVTLLLLLKPRMEPFAFSVTNPPPVMVPTVMSPVTSSTDTSPDEATSSRVPAIPSTRLVRNSPFAVPTPAVPVSAITLPETVAPLPPVEPSVVSVPVVISVVVPVSLRISPPMIRSELPASIVMLAASLWMNSIAISRDAFTSWLCRVNSPNSSVHS